MILRAKQWTFSSQLTNNLPIIVQVQNNSPLTTVR